MPKTYSVAILNKNGHWITNYNEYFNLDDIDFQKLETFIDENQGIGYGYYFGENSRSLTSDKNRTVVKIKIPKYTLNRALKILLTGGRIFYLGGDGLIKSLKIKRERAGFTFLFGNGVEDNKIIQKRWYDNGEAALVNFLSGNLGLSNE